MSAFKQIKYICYRFIQLKILQLICSEVNIYNFEVFLTFYLSAKDIQHSIQTEKGTSYMLSGTPLVSSTAALAVMCKKMSLNQT